MASYSLAGYTPPAGVDSRQKVKEYQTRLGVAADGIWGPKTQAAYEASLTGGRNDWSTPARIYGGYYDQALSLYAPPRIQAYTPPRAEIERMWKHRCARPRIRPSHPAARGEKRTWRN